jgi:acetyltransferase-like isoleucine patch superfamily enzyme
MSYFTQEQLSKLGFKSFGKNVKISDKAAIYDCDNIEIGDNSRVDDFCVVSGSVKIGRNVHITPMCLIAGGEKGVILEDFVTISYGVKIFTQSDDYHGYSLTNSTIPKEYKNEKKLKVLLKRHSIVGSGSIILPGVVLEVGVSIGAMSLVTRSTNPWSIYAGIPAVKIKERSKELLKKEKEYLKKYNNN